MKKYDFKVEQPTLLGASFSVMTSADGEPIVAKSMSKENGLSPFQVIGCRTVKQHSGHL
jgi:hypothetical protein